MTLDTTFIYEIRKSYVKMKNFLHQILFLIDTNPYDAFSAVDPWQSFINHKLETFLISKFAYQSARQGWPEVGISISEQVCIY